MQVGVSGQYQFTGIQIGELGLSCLAIEDLATGVTHSLSDGAVVSITMSATADPSVPRFVLHVNRGPVATFEMPTDPVVINEPVQFIATATTGNYAWDFGDGGTSSEQEPVHAYVSPGIYPVTLTVDNGICQAQTSEEIIVELSTGTAPLAAGVTARAWGVPDGIVVEHDFLNDDPVVIEVLDAIGRVHMHLRSPIASGRTILSDDGLSSGIWFVRLTNNGQQITFRVPLLR